MLAKWGLYALTTVLTLGRDMAAQAEPLVGHPLELEARQGSEGLMEMQKNNEKRYSRLVNLNADVENIEQRMIDDERAWNTSSPYYKDVYERYAQRLNFPTFADLLEDASNIMEQGGLPGSEIWADYREADDATQVSYMVAGVVGGIASVGNIYYKNAYNIPLFSGPNSKWTYLQKVRMVHFKARQVPAVRSVWSNFKLNIFAKTQAQAKVTEIVSDASTSGVVVKRTIFANAADVNSFEARAAKVAVGVKWGSRVAKFVEVVSVLAVIGTIIAEAVIAHQTRADLRAAIKDIIPVRFQLKMLQMQGEVWDEFQLNITSAADTWLTLQNLADAGQNCYLHTDVALAEKVDQATWDMLERFSAITNETVWERLVSEDAISEDGNAWLLHDLTLQEVLDVVYAESDNPTEEQYQAADVEIEASKPENALPLDPSAVNATNCRYVELADNKGALWKLSGPFWSYQEGPNPENPNEATVRHRLQEIERTESEIKLTLLSTDAVSVPEEAVTIDMDANTVDFKGSQLAMSPEFHSNLIPTNGWNTYYVGLNVSDPHSDEDIFTNAFECNRVAGWKMTWSDSWGGGFISDMFQLYRDKETVKISAFNRAGNPKSPSANVDFEAATLHAVVNDEDIDNVFAVNEDLTLPRVTID